MNKLLEISTGKINSNYNVLLMEAEFLNHYITPYSILLISRITAIRNWKNRIPEICRKFHAFQARIKISVSTDISVIGFYGYIGYIGDISVDIFT